MYQKGDIVVVEFPFSDGTASKRRPALVICGAEIQKSGDILLVQITSKAKRDGLSISLDNSILDKPLPLKSYVRIHKIFVLDSGLVLGKISSIKKASYKTITKAISAIIS